MAVSIGCILLRTAYTAPGHKVKSNHPSILSPCQGRQRRGQGTLGLRNDFVSVWCGAGVRAWRGTGLAAAAATMRPVSQRQKAQVRCDCPIAERLDTEYRDAQQARELASPFASRRQ